MAVIYRINMSDRTVRTEEADQTCRRLGGRGLTSTMLAAEVPPDCHPLSAENKLIFAPGILTGTAAPCSGRLSVGAKSPLTGTIKESNAGGTAAIAMATLGIKAIVLEGKPTEKTLYRLVIGHDGVKIEEADDLAGLGNYDTVAKEFERFGDKVTCMSIGPAGEMFAAAATIAVTDMENRPTRHCGRGGLGAVMGSKGVKTIILDPAGGARPKPADPERFKAAARKFAKALKNNPISGEGLPTFGTNSLADVMDQAGGFPTRNFSQGQFEGIEKINAQRQYDLITERKGVIAHACHPGCTIKCSRIYMDKDGKYLTKGPEYETIWAHGPNCGIDDLDAIAQMDRIDDDLGLDTIETGVTIGVAMEAGILPFGDAEGAIGLLEEVRKRTPLGRLVAAGADVLGKAYGVERIPTTKGQAMPAYDPRAVQGIGVTYATSTMGADHTAGYTIGANILGVGGNVDPLKPDGQVELSRTLQIATAAIDASGLCLFVAFAMLDDPTAMEAVCEMHGALFGEPYTAEDFTAMGAEIIALERAFNTAAGFGPAADRLPRFFKTEPLAPHNVTFTVPDEELDKAFQ
jgi:aldehyde:ferredoxin oxidoreductase